MAVQTASKRPATEEVVDPGELIPRGKKRMIDNIFAAGRKALYYWSGIDSEGSDVEMDRVRSEYGGDTLASLYRVDTGCYRVVMQNKSFFEFTTPESDLGNALKPVSAPTYSELSEIVMALMQGQTKQTLKNEMGMADSRADHFLDVVSRLQKLRENSEAKPFWHGQRINAARVLEHLTATLYARLPVKKEECYGSQFSDREAGDPSLHSYQALFNHEGRLWTVRVQHEKDQEQK